MTFGGSAAPDNSRPRYAPPADRQQAYASALAQPTAYAPPAPVVTTPGPALPALPVPSKRGRTASIWLFGLLGFVLVALIGYFVWALGAVASGVGLIIAVVPLAIVFLGVHIIDRWEPEPKSMIAFAIAWGAVAAIGITLLVDLGITLEIAKGLGILIIFLIGRRVFDGPVDGIVYGALIGGGFAFTENIQYFAISLIEGGGTQLTATFVMRGLLSPFAHAMFTSLTGFAMGLAARRHASKSAVAGAGLIGLAGAMLLHGFWNGSATFSDFFAVYITLQVPLFIGFILAIVALRREEARLTRERLGEYAAAGWFTPEEVTMLATPAGRKVGMKWASTLSGDRRALMKQFITDATALAAVRQRAITGRDPLAADDERALLTRTTATRAALLAY
jgi:RsiW-degrading membrane proteinase PrsW (M82 family)